MIRKLFYSLLILLAYIWGAINLSQLYPGTLLDLSPLLSIFPKALTAIAIPPKILMGVGWFCLGLSALSYLVGLALIYFGKNRDPWRMVLFTSALFVMAVGGVFLKLQLSGLIDQSSLNLIFIMLIPFLPIVLFLPLIATFKRYVASRSSA